MALYLKDESTFELEITKYNIDDFSAERKKEGYLCTLEGNFFLILWDKLTHVGITFLNFYV